MPDMKIRSVPFTMTETGFSTASNAPEEKPLHTKVKAMQVEIDRSIKDAEHLLNHLAHDYVRSGVYVLTASGGVREAAFALQHLEEAKMWLGKVLGATGHTLPEAYRDEAPDGNR